MSAWDDYNGGGPAVAGTGGSRQFDQSGGVGLPSGQGGVYHPAPAGVGPAGTPPPADAQPGVVSINPLAPGNTSLDPISQLFNGLRQATVGGNEQTPQGEASRKHSLVGSQPVIGDVGRAVADVLGGVGEVVGGAAAGIGGAAERIPPGDTSMVDAEFEQAKAEALKTPNGAKLWEETQAAIDKEHGLFGTGLIDNDAHLKSVFTRKWREESQYANPTLAPGRFTAPGSLADTISGMMDPLSVSAEVAAKGWAGLSTPGQGGLDRLGLIKAVGDGRTNFASDTGLAGTGILAGDKTTGLNDMEQLVYTKVKSGDWTDDEARDFLASNGQAFGHSALANVGGGLALDPLNLATLGAGTIAKIGLKGATMVERLAAAEAQFAKLGTVFNEAQAVRDAATGTRAIKAADAALAAAKADVEAAQVSRDAFRAFRSGGSVRGINFVARSAEDSTKVGAAFRLAGRAYKGLEGNSIGRAAKVTRTIIDPLHAIDLHMPGASKTVDLYSDSIVRSVVDTAGVHHYKGMLDEALRLDKTRGMYDQLTKDIAVASSNLGREGVGEMFRADQIAGNLGEELMKTLPDDVFETAVQTTKHRDLEKWLRFNSLKHVLIDTWDEAAHRTLAQGLEQTYHTRSAADWMTAFKTMSKEQKSLYKFAVYGSSNRRLLDFVTNMTPEVAAKLPVPPRRMVLVAPRTLTRINGEALLTKLDALKTTKAKLKLIAEAQSRYPSLRYVTIDSAARERSVDNFITNLQDGMDRLPMQLKDDELAALGDAGQALRDTVGDYRLGFRPDDQFLWGLEREAGTGLYRPATAAWVDHVADGAISYRPASYLRLNLAGHPIVGIPVLRAGVRVVDHLDSAARLMKSQVSSAMVAEAARKRFISQAITGKLAEHGVTEQVANSWFDRITEFTREHQGYSGPRGMGGDDLYEAIKSKNLIPQTLLNGERRLNPDDVMRLVLEAYDGDMRHIGLTQKLTGRAKRYLFETTGSNFAGQIAEHAWPTMKFRYNPIFQLQEKIEPWVLNAQRGVSFATGVNLSEADRATESLLQRMTDNSLVRQADVDNFDQSAAVLFGKSTTKTAATPGTRLSGLQQLGRSLGDVQGMKRVNMFRTFRNGLGKELKASWDEARPGDWAKMKEAADLRAGRILNEDDFALQLVSENAYANDVFVSRVLDKSGQFTGLKADWANAIKTGAWHSPTTLGELQALDLEHVASSLHLVNAAGEDIKDLTGLRQVLATEPDAMQKVLDGLTRLGADPDYIRRVRNGLDFSWSGFWKTAETRFSLTGDESRKLQDMMAQAASLRNMTPVEFMSQVFSPSLINGTEGVLGHLEGQVRILRDARAAGRNIKPREAKLMESRTQLAGKEGVSNRADLIRQLSGAFSAHLDPSAKRALLLEFRPELVDAVKTGKVKLDLQEVQDMWDNLADDELSNRILRYMDGKTPTHASSPLDNARGVKAVRDAATRYMQERGVKPLEGRPHFKLDAEMQAHYEEGAKHFRDLPSVEYDRTGRIPNVSGLNKSGVDLKPQPTGVDDATYRAYQAFVADTRAQYDFMTRPTAKGGLGIKVTVTKKDFTGDSSAVRADVAKGRLSVWGGTSDHPLMTNEQNVMFRAVHDVFGHSAEGFEFGPRGELNAAAKHARMYSNEGRPAMLTETHGQTSYVNYSDDIYAPASAAPTPLNTADPVADFESRYPFDVSDRQKIGLGPDDPLTGYVTMQGVDEYGVKTSLRYGYTQRVGDGIRGLAPDVQHAILQPVADLFDEFPNLRIHHIDAVDFNEPLADLGGVDTLTGAGMPDAYAVTWGADSDESVVIFNTKHVLDKDWAFNERQSLAMKGYDTRFTLDPKTGKSVETPRLSRFGVSWHAGELDIQQVSRHEAGHAFDVAKRPHRMRAKLGEAPRWEQYAAKQANEPYHEMMTRFENEAGRLDLSEYGMTSSAEFAAELFSYSTNPKLIVANIQSPELRAMVEEFQQFLKDSGEWVPKAKPSPLAGKTIAEVNAIKRGTAYAPQKAGLLPQPYLDDFINRFVGTSKNIESNPDVARTAQMFGKWTDAVVTNGLLKGEHSVFANLLHDVAGLPTGAAVPYNFTEAATAHLAHQSMVRKWDDAFRLQYFSQERSFLERSLNHPMFGMYPASYMWGKIMPELVRTIAANPFGNRTGGLLYSAMDVQAAIALRREYDAEFDAKLEELGHSQALSFAGYMLPTLPWDISASAPPWMRSIADQGIRNSQGGPAKAQDISLLDPAVSTLKKLAPLTTTLPWAGRAVDELNGPADAAQVRKDATDHSKLVRASELKPELQRVMQELQEALR